MILVFFFQAEDGIRDIGVTGVQTCALPISSIKTVNVRFMPEESSRVVAMRSGEVDVIDTISPESAEQLAGLPDVRIQSTEGTRINQLFYNFRKPPGHPLADPRVREALTYAIDGQALVEQVFLDSVTEATGVVPGSLTGAKSGYEYVFDPRRCRQLLDAQGIGPDDLELTVIWETGEFANDTLVMESLVQMFRDVGVRTRLQQFEPGGDISTWRRGEAGDWDVLGNGFPNPTGLALTTLQGMYGGTVEKEQTRDTYHGYVFPEVERLISAASAEIDPAARQTLLDQAQDAVWDTWPCLWAFVPNAVLARQDRKSTRLNSSHANISYAVFCLKKKKSPATLPVSPSLTISIESLFSFPLLASFPSLCCISLFSYATHLSLFLFFSFSLISLSAL